MQNEVSMYIMSSHLFPEIKSFLYFFLNLKNFFSNFVVLKVVAFLG